VQPIFLDNNATTRPWPEVVETVSRHMAGSFANPGSRHSLGRTARRVLEDARESMAAILGANPKEILFTSGGTESINAAILGLTGGKPGRLARTQGEHPATRECCDRLEKLHGWKQIILKVNPEGRLLSNQFENLSWNELRLVTVILAHNETGVIQDLGPLSERCQKHSVPLHVDAVQAVGKIPVNFQELGATALSLGAHKFHGPRGIGALLLRKGVELSPWLFGGHQEQGRRPGTEPVALIAGMAKALEIWHADQDRRTARVKDLRDRLQQGLEKTCGRVVINGSLEHRLPNTLNISFPGLDGEALLVALDLEGIACSLGSTCASGSTEPAPSLVAMGLSEEIYRSAVRFSLAFDNTEEEITEAIPRIAAVVKRLRVTNGNGG
jgi:cysteine desulfurase